MRKTILLLIVCLLATNVFGQQPAVATDTNTLKQQAGGLRSSLEQQLQIKLDEWHKAGKFPGATLGVVLANGESFSLAVGYSDRDSKTPMKPTDRMLAGSVGKTFAAATALQLVKEGKINLDEKVEKYLGGEPWFSRLPNAKDITVRQLMNHTSGLVRYEFKDKFTRDLTANPEKRWQPAELVAYLLDEKAPFPAGQGWDYSDTNYIVLGMIIEKVTGKKFYDEANRRLIKPLKLTNTIPQDGLKLIGVVQGYAGPNNPFGGKDEMIHAGKFIINPQFEWTGGGYASTAEDLARWAKMIYEGRAYSADLLPQVLDGVPAPMLGRETRYGLGVIIRKTAAGTSYGHSGFFPGYMTDMMYFPEQKIAIAVQVNTSVPRDLGKPLGRVIWEVLDVVRGTSGKSAFTEGQSGNQACLAPEEQNVYSWERLQSVSALWERNRTCRPSHLFRSHVFGTFLGNKADALKDWTGNGCQVKSVSVSNGFATALSPTVEMLTRKGTADGTCGGQEIGGTDIWGVSIYVKDGDAWKFAFGMNVAAM